MPDTYDYGGGYPYESGGFTGGVFGGGNVPNSAYGGADDWFAQNGFGGMPTPQPPSMGAGLSTQTDVQTPDLGIGPTTTQFDTPLDLPARQGPPVARHGGTIDPGTGRQTVGQPTPIAQSPAPALGGAPAPPGYSPFSYGTFDQRFSAPTAEDAANSPGYQDALKQAQQALARSAAAKGTLLTGGTAKALQQQAVSYANQNYQNVYNNALTKFQTDQSQYQQGLVNALQIYATNNNMSQQQYQNLLQQYGLNVANTNTANQLGYNYDVLNSQNTNAQNQLGLGYAGLYANTSGSGAQSYADYLTQGGNASAAGSVGAGNAWSGLASGLGNTALYASLLKKPSTTGNGLPGYTSQPY